MLSLEEGFKLSVRVSENPAVIPDGFNVIVVHGGPALSTSKDLEPAIIPAITVMWLFVLLRIAP